MMLARFLRLFSRYGGSLSSSTSGADRPLNGPDLRTGAGSTPGPAVLLLDIDFRLDRKELVFLIDDVNSSIHDFSLVRPDVGLP